MLDLTMSWIREINLETVEVSGYWLMDEIGSKIRLMVEMG